MRVAQVDADGSFYDGEGRSVGNYTPRRARHAAMGQVKNEMFRSSVSRLGQATQATPQTSTPIPALRDLAQSSAKDASGYSIQIVDGMVFPKMTGDPAKDLIIGQFVFPKNDPMPVYTVSARPTKGPGVLKLMKIEKGEFGPEGSWVEVPLNDFRANYMVSQTPAWLEMAALFTRFNPRLEDGKVSAENTQRVGLEWQLAVLWMALDSLNEKGLSASELADATTRTSKGGDALAAYTAAATLAYEAFDMSAAGMDGFWLGPRAMMLIRTVAADLLDGILGVGGQPGVLQLTMMALAAGANEANFKAAGNAYDALMNKSPYWNTLLTRVRLREATERLNWVGLRKEMEFFSPNFAQTAGLINSNREEIKRSTNLTDADLDQLFEMFNGPAEFYGKTAASYTEFVAPILQQTSTKEEDLQDLRNYFGNLVRANALTVKSLQDKALIHVELSGLGAATADAQIFINAILALGPGSKPQIVEKAQRLIEIETRSKAQELAASRPEVVPLRERVIEIVKKDLKEIVNKWLSYSNEWLKSVQSQIPGADLPNNVASLKDSIKKAKDEGKIGLARQLEKMDELQVVQTRDAISKLEETANNLAGLASLPVEQGGGVAKAMQKWMEFFLEIPAQENIYANTAGVREFVGGLNRLASEVGFSPELQAMIVKAMFMEQYKPRPGVASQTTWRSEMIRAVGYFNEVIADKQREIAVDLEPQAKAGNKNAEVAISRRKADIDRMTKFITAIEAAIKYDLPPDLEVLIRQAQRDETAPTERDPKLQWLDAEEVVKALYGIDGKSGYVSELERALNETTKAIAEGGSLASEQGRTLHKKLSDTYNTLIGKAEALKQMVDRTKPGAFESNEQIKDLARRRIDTLESYQEARKASTDVIGPITKTFTLTKIRNFVTKFAAWIIFPEVMAPYWALEKLHKTQSHFFAQFVIGGLLALGVANKLYIMVSWLRGRPSITGFYGDFVSWVMMRFQTAQDGADPRPGSPGGPGMPIMPPKVGAEPSGTRGFAWWELGLVAGGLAALAAPNIVFPFIGNAFKGLVDVVKGVSSIVGGRRGKPGRPGTREAKEAKLKGRGAPVIVVKAVEEYQKAKEAGDTKAMQRAVEKLAKAKERGQGHEIPPGVVPGF